MSEQRRLIVRNERIRAAGEAMVRHMPVDDERPWEIIIRPLAEKRRDRQNRFYWLRLGEIAEQAWLDGRAFSSESWHEYAKLNIMDDVVELKSGDMASKWVELPGGRRYVRSTTGLSVKAFARYCTQVERFGAEELGVQFSAAPVDI